MIINVSEEFLRKNPYSIFVFGDNLDREGIGGAASLRHLPNTYGFITKKRITHEKGDYYKPEEYEPVFYKELNKLCKTIEDNPEYTYLISRLGAGLANKYMIWEKVIQPKLRKTLSKYKNVKFLFDESDEIHTNNYCGYVDQQGKLVVYEVASEEEKEIKLIAAQNAKLVLKPLNMIREESLVKAIQTYQILLDNKVI